MDYLQHLYHKPYLDHLSIEVHFVRCVVRYTCEKYSSTKGYLWTRLVEPLHDISNILGRPVDSGTNRLYCVSCLREKLYTLLYMLKDKA